MSVALELWRALEAWDPDRHPRGPGGRFIKALGSSRPSLADVVRGTAAGGPKRQRTDRGGMTVGDAVRAAARQSDTTGRPTQRPVAEHRAHGAHDVADEVDRALADAGVPEDVRRQVAGRARAAADSHGARPGSLPKPSKKLAKLSDQQLERGLQMHGNQTPRGKEIQAEVIRRQVDTAPAVSNPDAVKADIRSAVSRLQQEQGGWVGLADLREQLGDGRSREDVDAALLDLLDEPGVRIIPVANTKALKPRDREAAVRIGGEDNHAISISGAPAPKPSRKPPAVSGAEVERQKVDAAKADIRSAVQRLEAEPGAWVNLEQLRNDLGERHNRHDVDQALKLLDREPGVNVAPEENQKTITQSERDAALRIGGQDNHLVRIAPSSAAPAPKAAPKATSNPRADAYEKMDPKTVERMAGNVGIDPTGMSRRQVAETLAAHDARSAASAPQYGNSGIVEVGRPVITDLGPRAGGPVDRTEIGGWKSGRSTRPASGSLDTARAATDDARRQLADALVNAPSRAVARDALSGLTVRELRALAGDMGATVGSKDTKPKLIDRLVEIPGRRLDRDAIDRMARKT